METLRARFSVQPATPVVFSGYASVFNTLIDARVPTIIEPGAFTRTVAQNWDRIKILWQHNEAEPIGKPLVLREDARGLFLKAQLSTTPRALEAAQLLRDGVMSEMSIGFDIVREYPKGNVRHITELTLWEVSLVTFGANPAARIASVQQRPPTPDEIVQRLEAQLRAFEERQGARAVAHVDQTLHELKMLELDRLAQRLRS